MFSDDDIMRYNFSKMGSLSLILGSLLALSIAFFHPASEGHFDYPKFFLPTALLLICVFNVITTAVVKYGSIKRKVKIKVTRAYHTALFFILPISLSGFSHHFISGLWFYPTASFIFIQIFYGNSSVIRYGAVGLPLYAYLLHFIAWNSHYDNKIVPIELLFTLFLLAFYWHLGTHFFKIFISHDFKKVRVEDKETFYFKYGLTEREQQIASSIIEGLSIKEIASLYDISEGTVKNHTQNIYRKMNINSKMKLLDKFIKYRRG